MDASDWKYIFPTSDEEIMGWRVYWTAAISNNSLENYAVAGYLSSLLWKELFCKIESKV